MSIALDRLTKTLGRQLVVHSLSLEVKDGELFVLLGPSGSGKSTVLRLISGLLQPDSGRILLQGRDVTHLPPQARGVGFVFQNYSIFRHMSVAQNIEFALKIRGVPEQERARRRNELLDLVDLSGLGNRYAHQLSGGQQQRVALARALAHEPAILLLDEPFGALDVRTRTQLRRSLREIVTRLRVMTILVTHDQEEAFELADRIGVIDRGRLLETGEPAHLYSKPQRLFCATFVGNGTVVVGRAKEGRVQLGDIALPIPDERPHEDGASVRVLFRPEEVMVSESLPPSDLPFLGKGVVLDKTFNGSHYRLRLRLPRLGTTRQVAPAPFGEEELLVEALLPSEIDSVPDELYVALRSWRILEPPRLKILYCHSGQSSAALAPMVRQFRDRLNASVRVLAVASSSESGERLTAAVHEQLHENGLGDSDLLVRYGKAEEQILNEQASDVYAMIIMARSDHVHPEANRIGSRVSAVLRHAIAPVLVAQAPRPRLRRILICTAAGEPGKSDVRVGGWMARRLGAAVTLLNVVKGPEEPDPTVRSHLERALATLRALDIEAESRMTKAPKPAEAILAEARDGGYDLIVVGSHGPEPKPLLGRDNVASKVLSGADRPVLVVPAE